MHYITGQLSWGESISLLLMSEYVTNVGALNANCYVSPITLLNCHASWFVVYRVLGSVNNDSRVVNWAERVALFWTWKKGAMLQLWEHHTCYYRSPFLLNYLVSHFRNHPLASYSMIYATKLSLLFKTWEVNGHEGTKDKDVSWCIPTQVSW